MSLQHFQIRQDGSYVTVSIQGHVMKHDWATWLEISKALLTATDSSGLKFNLRKVDDNTMLLSLDGHDFTYPIYVWREIAKAIKQQSQVAEQVALSQQLIDDTALAYKIGLPVGFSDLQGIKDEAMKEGLWGKFNKYLGRDVKVGAKFGLPKLIRR